jgi:threonine dehydrogenase-like Zn-dependent dehydrogenase
MPPSRRSALKAFVLVGPRDGRVEDVDRPMPGDGQAVVDVARVGLCGTDVEFFTGEMAYLHEGHAAYPIRIGHEWSGTVAAVGEGVDAGWIGRRVTGDTMLGCGHCHRCTSGRQHLCANRFEIGVRGGWPGALAEQLLVPVSALHELPQTMDDEIGALVEPGANALRSVEAASLSTSGRAVVWGAGTIGLLAAMFARARGVEVDVIGRSPSSIDRAVRLGFAASTIEDLADGPFEVVIDATNDASVPVRALDLVEPGGRVVFIGLAGTPSLVDTRTIALKDVTVVGILGGSGGLAATIEEYASGRVDPRPLIAATVGLDEVADVLAGRRPAGAGRGPKILVDPRR